VGAVVTATYSAVRVYSLVGDRRWIHWETWYIRWRAELTPRAHQRRGLPILYAEATLGGLTYSWGMDPTQSPRISCRYGSSQQHVPAALYPRERPGTHFTGGWVGPKTGLDRRKISFPPGFDPGSYSPQSVAIPTELPGPQYYIYICIYIYIHILVFKPSPCSKCNLFLFWVIPRRLSSNCRRFGTHCRFHLHRQVNEIFTCIWRWNRKWVPKRRLLELRRRGITQKGTQYILYIFVWAPVTHVTITTAFSAKLSPSTLHACYWTLSQ